MFKIYKFSDPSDKCWRNNAKEILMKKLIVLLALLSVPFGISTAIAGSCGYGDHTHTDKDKKETK